MAVLGDADSVSLAFPYMGGAEVKNILEKHHSFG